MKQLYYITSYYQVVSHPTEGLKCSVADSDPGSGSFLTLGSGIRNPIDPGSGMEKFGSGVWDKHPGSETLLKCVIFVGIQGNVGLPVLYETHPHGATYTFRMIHLY